MTRSIFLAGPFKSLVQKKNGLMTSKDIRMFSRIIDYFENLGWSIHSAHKREGWGKDFMAPEECTKIDFDEISKSDFFVAFPGVPASPGTHVEIGWASALEKPLILILEEDKEYAFLVRGLSSVAHIKFLFYNGSEINPECIHKTIELMSKTGNHQAHHVSIDMM